MRTSRRNAGSVAITRRRFLTGAGVAAAATGVSTAGYAGAEAAWELAIAEYRLRPPRWPGRFSLSIGVVADVHAGGPNMGLRRIAEIVERMNALKPDLIVLLGDYFATHPFVTERVPHADWARELARLSAPLGVHAILGNHDWWHDVAGVRSALAQVKIPLLENEARLLGVDGQRFWLAGLGDQVAYRLGRGRFEGVDDLPGTLAQVRTDDPVILLAHEPDIFAETPDRISLTLAGHTHGGQLRIPFIWPHFVPSRYGARYAHGHIVEGGRHMIVSGGLGTSFVPLRMGAPPELVLVRLGA